MRFAPNLRPIQGEHDLLNGYGTAYAVKMSRAKKSETIQELEDSDWGDPATGETPLIQKCLALRRKPMADFSIEDLRLAIGQKMGLRFLVPLAMDRLRQNPLSEGNLYPGDLLRSVLRVPLETWAETEDLRFLAADVPSIARRFLDYAKGMDEEQREILGDLIDAAERAANIH